jgi:type II secretion system protein C
MNMSKISNSSLVSVLIKLLIFLATAKAIALLLWWFLPSEGVDLKEETNFKPPYQRVDFKNMLQVHKRSNAVNKESATTTAARGISITNMVLKGLYGNRSKGFAIVALKATPNKTTIISVGDSFSGYKLKAILQESVLFVKAGKEFVLKMPAPKQTPSAHLRPVKRTVTNEQPYSVARQDIQYYEKHPNQIWKDISIVEVRNGGRIEGFKVTRVRRNSKMAKLGLQRGDIIIRANNVDLTSYKKAFDLYAKIDKIKTLQLVVLRNNEEKELIYEVH